MNNVKSDEPAVKTVTFNGVELTPVNVFGSKEQEEQFIKKMNSPENQNYFANQMQQEIYKNIGFSDKLNDIPYRNPNETLEKQAEEYLKEISRLNNTVEELKTTNSKLADVNHTLEENNKHYWRNTFIISFMVALIFFVLGILIP